MSQSLTSFFHLLGDGHMGAPPLGALPSAYFGAWDETISANKGSGAFILGAPSSSYNNYQKSITGTFSTFNTGIVKKLGLAQLILGGPMMGQSAVSAANWTIALALQMTNAQASFTWQAYIGLYLVDSTGALKTTIVALSALGSSGRTSTSELTSYSSTVSGATFTPAAGDYLVLEIGVAVDNSLNNTTAPVVKAFSEGTTNVSSDNASATSASTFITSPTALALDPFQSRFQQNLPPAPQPRLSGGTRYQQALPPPLVGRGTTYPSGSNPLIGVNTFPVNFRRMNIGTSDT